MVIGCGVVGRCTCHIPDTKLRVPSGTTYHFFSTFVCVAINVDVQPLSRSCPMEISSLYWRWGSICTVLYILDNNGMRFSSAL